MTPTSVGMRCPECSRERTRVHRARTMTDEPRLTYALVAINVIVFLAEFFSGVSAGGGSFGGSDLIRQGALYGPDIANGEVYRLLTAGFLHAGFAHLFFNMYSLYILGSLLEPAVGRLRFAIIYFVSLFAGSFGALIAAPTTLTVGASGAIFGMLGATLVVMRSRGVSAMESGLGLWLLLNLGITFLIPGISIGGHIGGLVGGTLAALAIYEAPRLRVPRTAALVLASLVGVIAIAGSIAVA
ncbi:MAG TPA: rhomboid family intramembrane serine protease [Thermoleophilaceae bacterium]